MFICLDERPSSADQASRLSIAKITTRQVGGRRR
jgi:hypothetical protein